MALPSRSVWIDAQACQSKTHSERGIARQVAELTGALVEANADVVHTIGLNPELPMPASLQSVLPFGRTGWVSGKGATPNPPPPIYHVTSPFEGARLDLLWPSWARRDGVRTVVTLHDLIPLLYPGRYWGPAATALYEARVELVRSAQHILSVSEASAADAVEHLGLDESRITVIDAGVSAHLASMAPSREEATRLLDSALPQVREPFLLYVGGDDWRKNMDGMISAYGLLPEELRHGRQLVIVCKLSDERRSELERHARRAGLRGDDLVLTGFVPDRELSALYRSCELFVFPSLYEGSGLPILEAMSCGAPVAASGTTSIPEVLGDLRGTFDPESPEDIAATVGQLLEHPDQLDALRHRSELRAGKSTWGRVAEKTLEGYERALAVPGRRSANRSRKRLAVFTPWPPDQPGVAAYSQRLVAELAERADVDVFAPGGEEVRPYDRALEPAVTVRTAGTFESLNGLNDYHRFLYVLGSSPEHIPALETLLRHPGVVLAMELRFSHLYAAVHHERYRFVSDWLMLKLTEMYGERIPEEELAQIPDDETESRFGVFMTQEIQAQADLMLVHSRQAAEELRMDCVPGRAAAETEIIPYAIAEAPRAAMRRSADGGAKLIAPVDDRHLDGAELTVHALAELASAHPGASLTLLGPLAEQSRVGLEQSAERLGVGDRVSFVERAEDAAYWDLVGSADLVVQVQERSDGDPWPMISDSIAARVPALVSDVGWAREIPDPAVLHLPHDYQPAQLGELFANALDDRSLRQRIHDAQDEYAAESSFTRVGTRCADLLGL